jgi:hypothetical protein
MELSVSVTQQIITSLDSSMETPVQKQSLPPALLTFSTCKFEYVWIAEKLWQSWHALLMHFHNPVPRLCQLALPWVKVLKDNYIRQSPSTFLKKRQWVSSSKCLVLLFYYLSLSHLYSLFSTDQYCTSTDRSIHAHFEASEGHGLCNQLAGNLKAK